LGGAALTRAYVEQDLAELFAGEVRYARDAFEGLHLMDAAMAVKRGVPGAALPALRQRRVKPRTATAVASGTVTGQAAADQAAEGQAKAAPGPRTVRADNPVPEPPFWGTRIIKGIPLAEYAAYLDERATFMGQWGLKPSRGGAGPSYEELVEAEGRPRLRMWLERSQTDGLVEAGGVYGYVPAVSGGDRPGALGDAGGH